MIRYLSLLIALTLAVASGCAALADTPVTVRTASGPVTGREVGDIAVFKGIPFAAPPVGALRWRPPQSAAAWSRPRDASAYGPACPQVTYPGTPNAGGYVGPTSEDCLNLNVFAPKGAHGAPVMVWIFGGGNVAGANSIPPNDGSAFARDGIVLVSVNYRLGALGFFAHPALTKAAPAGEPVANYAIMDQIAALKWVQRNIKRFGGDPANVTIFGESAGGQDVLTLMTSPAARGLFAKATVQSGGGWGKAPSLADAEARGVAIAQKLGLPADASVDQLRDLPLTALVDAGQAAQGVSPILDGHIVTESIAQAFAHGDQAPVPLIIGTNSDEASLLPQSSYTLYLAGQSPSVLAAYPDLLDDHPKLARAIFDDRAMGAPARWIAGRQSAKAPAFLYYFSYVRVVRRGKIPGANHTSENPYVFDTQMGIPNYADQIQAEDRAMATLVHSCWVSFAKTGAAACKAAPAWPAYAPASDQLMEFGLSADVRTGFRKAQRDAVEKAVGP
jgi:para-nitrobenzyl esterase